MKKKLFFFCVLAMLLTGCSLQDKMTKLAEIQATKTQKDYEKIYGNVIEKYYEFICSDMDENIEIEGETGVVEVITVLGPEVALNTVGYAIEDLTGDGIPELVIGECSESDSEYGTMIYALYTCVDEQPKLVFEGWYRSCYRWMGGNKFAYQGSGGAMYSIFGVAVLLEDGTELLWEDYYFTHETDESFSEIGCYYNTTGEGDVSKSKKMEMSLDDFCMLEQKLLKNRQWMPLTKIADYTEGL